LWYFDCIPMSLNEDIEFFLSNSYVDFRDEHSDNHHVECLPFNFKASSNPINLAERQYVREGRVLLATGMHTQERYLFLFTDLLLIAKSK